MGAHVLIYSILYAITVGFGLGVLLNRDTVKSALCLVGVMVSLAAHYLVMGQEFVFAIQIIVYAGAIMVLFLFVIMLLNMREREVAPWYLRNARFVGGASALVFFALVAVAINSFGSQPVGNAALPAPTIPELATLLTTKFALPFVLTSVLLLVAVIGAVVMGRRADPETGEEYHTDEADLFQENV
jgi:NADH-quinone oxidoreductase subunit J